MGLKATLSIAYCDQKLNDKNNITVTAHLILWALICTSESGSFKKLTLGTLLKLAI